MPAYTQACECSLCEAIRRKEDQYLAKLEKSMDHLIPESFQVPVYRAAGPETRAGRIEAWPAVVCIFGALCVLYMLADRNWDGIVGWLR